MCVFVRVCALRVCAYSSPILFFGAQVLGVMSAGLRGSIRMECCVNLIRSVPFFKDASDSFVYRVAQVSFRGSAFCVFAFSGVVRLKMLCACCVV
jgi:hypothetical protein